MQEIKERSLQFEGLKHFFKNQSPLRVKDGKVLPNDSTCIITDIRNVDPWNGRYIPPYIYFSSGLYRGFFQLGSYNSVKCHMALREINLNALLND